ncbi:hypothetical protein ACFLR5_00060 [Elusimicrobiota bacterium]
MSNKSGEKILHHPYPSYLFGTFNCSVKYSIKISEIELSINGQLMIFGWGE